MPFKSKAQQRFMYANYPEMAKEWSKETDFSKLPERLKKKKKAEKKVSSYDPSVKNLVNVMMMGIPTMKDAGMIDGAFRAASPLMKGAYKFVKPAISNMTSTFSALLPKPPTPFGWFSRTKGSIDNFRFGWNRAKDLGYEVDKAIPVVNNVTKYKYPVPNQVHQPKYFQKGRWQESQYNVAPDYQGEPISKDTVKAFHRATEKIMPNTVPQMNDQTGDVYSLAGWRQPAAVSLSNVPMSRNAAGWFDSSTGQIMVASGGAKTLGHEYGHTITQNGLDLLRHGYVPRTGTNAMGTLQYERLADEMGYQIAKRARQIDPAAVSQKMVKDNLNNVFKDGADSLYLPDAMKEYGQAFWRSPSMWAMDAGEDLYNLLSNRLVTGVRRESPRFRHVINALLLPSRNLNYALRGKGLVNTIKNHPLATLFGTLQAGTPVLGASYLATRYADSDGRISRPLGEAAYNIGYSADAMNRARQEIVRNALSRQVDNIQPLLSTEPSL
jgi:hypothetical protein